MSDAILLLRLEHSNMARLLDWLDEQIKTLETGAVPDYKLLNQALYYLQNYPDQCHHPKEDLVLKVLLHRNPEDSEVIGDLAGEHIKLATLTSSVASALNQTDGEQERSILAQALRELVEDYRRHMTMEEKYFFPLALEHLENGDWESINFELFDRDDPLFDHSQEEQFRRLREGISLSSRRYLEMNTAREELKWLRNLNGIDEFNRTMKKAGSRLRLVRFNEGGYGLERDGKLLAYIPSYEGIHAIWCAYYYAKGAEEISFV